MTRKLGRVQEKVLGCLRSHKRWSPHCGWIWGSEQGTKKIMDRLVQLGHATELGGVYFPVQEEKIPQPKCDGVPVEDAEGREKCALCGSYKCMEDWKAFHLQNQKEKSG